MNVLYANIPPIPFDMAFWYKENKTLEERRYMIDVTLKLRSSVPPQLITLIGSYVVKQEDVSDPDKLKLIVYMCNFTPGPVIMYINHVIGYGLFADRDYDRHKDEVTVYGGIVTRFSRIRDAEEGCRGDYAMLVDKKTCIDGLYGFKLSQKGRFINEAHNVQFDGNIRLYKRQLQERENVTLVAINGEGQLPVFRVKGTFGLNIAKGDEFLWFYGPEYDRKWLTVPDNDAKRPRILNCVLCGDETVLGCSKCNTVYCSDVCKQKAGHYCYK